MDRAEAQMIAQELGIVLARQSSSNSSSTDSSKGVQRFSQSIGDATENLGRMATGAQSFQDTAKFVGNTIGQFGGPVLNAVSDIVSKTGSFMFETNNILKDVSKSGFTFGQDLGEFSKLVVGANMSTQQFRDLIKQSGETLVGLGGNAEKSGITFLKTATALGQSETVQKMNLLGIGMDEFNTTLRITMFQRRNLDMQDMDVRRNLMNSTITTVQEMNEVARLTGRSREELQQQMEKRARETDVELAQAGMTEAERDAFNRTQQLAALAKMEDIAKIVSLGGPVSAEEGRKIAVADPESMRILDQYSKIQGNSEEAERRRLELRIQFENRQAERIEKEGANLRLQSTLFRTGDAAMTDMARQAQGALAVGTSALQMQRDYANSPELQKQYRTYTDYRKSLMEAEEQRIKTAGTTAAGPATTAQALNFVEMLQKDVNAIVAAKVFPTLSDTIGETVNLIRGNNKSLTDYRVSVSDVNNLIDEMKRKVRSEWASATATGVSEVKREDVPADIRRRREGKADGGDIFSGDLVPIGERGMEFFSPFTGGKVISNEIIQSMTSTMAALQGDLRANIKDARDNPLASVVDRLAETMSNVPNRVAPSGESSITTDIKQELVQLNISVKELITHNQSLIDNTLAQIRATKGLSGNILG